MASLPLLCLLAALLLRPVPQSSAAAGANAENTTTPFDAYITEICRSTPYPETCTSTLKLSISISIDPSILTFVFRSLESAIASATRLASLFPSPSSTPSIVEKKKGSIQDCVELHQITISSLQKSASIFQSSPDQRRLSDARAYLSAASTNRRTCLDGLQGSTGPMAPSLLRYINDAYMDVSNSLAILARASPPAPAPAPGTHRRRLLGNDGFPRWMPRRDHRILQNDYGSGDYGSSGSGADSGGVTVTVAADGTGNFTTVSEAVRFVPSNSEERVYIVVRAGVYEENVEVTADKTNVVLLGDGSDVTVIRGSRSAADGWTSFRSATLAVSGQGFLARDITIENTAGAAKGQATAVRVNADLAAFYHCTIAGYQDTLYAHSFRQFYRECNVLGTIDFIYGNAAVIFQGCSLFARVPMPGQSNVVTAQGRGDPNEDTGTSFQRCSVVASGELTASPGSARTFLGRPWQVYSRTVYMESFLDGLVDPAGWLNWVGDQGLDTLYYGEYDNNGPGSGTDSRVSWLGYHVMSYDDAVPFTVSEFIQGDQWLDSTSFPYDDGV